MRWHSLRPGWQIIALVPILLVYAPAKLFVEFVDHKL